MDLFTPKTFHPLGISSSKDWGSEEGLSFSDFDVSLKEKLLPVDLGELFVQLISWEFLLFSTTKAHQRWCQSHGDAVPRVHSDSPQLQQ